jgi:acyl-homoserine lactone synthase
MLCHCVTPANRGRYSRQLEGMFRRRHEVFVDGLGWRELRRTDRRDIDEFDAPETVYLLVIDDDGEAVASTRLNPTFGRYQLEDGGWFRPRFSDLAPPSGPDVWEASRLVGGNRERYGRDHARATLGVLLAGSQEFCVRRGVRQGLSILDLGAAMMLQSVGLETTPLGLPVDYETDKGTASAMAITWNAGVRHLVRLREVFGIVGPVLYEAPPVLGDDDVDAPNFALLETVSALRNAEALQAVYRQTSELLERERAAAREQTPGRRFRRRVGAPVSSSVPS